MKLFFRYLFIVLTLSFLLLILYKNEISHKVPLNPLVNYSAESLQSIVLEEYHLENNEYKYETSTDSKTNELIFEYFRDLKLKPIKWDKLEIDDESKLDIRISAIFSFGEYSQDRIFINDIFLNNPVYLRISSNNPEFESRAGYYRIIDEEFDYEYIDYLMKNISD